jgi:Tol biopolymer transport system component
MARDLSTGQERLLATFPNPQNRIMPLSPDGRALVARWVDGSPAKLHMATVAVDGSGTREVFTTDDRSSAQIVAWDRDGRSILFDQRQPGEGNRWGVMRVPAGGGPASLVFTTPSPIQGFDVSPDGSRIAYSSNESASELWALDNVLPMLK